MREQDWEGEPQAADRRTREQVLRELRAVYRRADEAYAAFSCPASGECCQLALTRREPWLWLPEWLLLVGERPLPPARADGACPFLDATGKRCTRYADRPFGCRTYFCVRMRGPAHQPLAAVVELSRRIEFLSQRLEPGLGGPRPLLAWHAHAASHPEDLP